MRQLGLALLHYHDANGALPANSPWKLNDVPPDIVRPEDRKGSMLIKLMPHVEQQDYFSMVDFDGDVFQQFEDKPELRRMQINLFYCPSDANYREGDDGRGLTNYGPSVGAQATFCLRPACIAPYPGNIFGTGPEVHANTDSWEDTSGLFSRRKFAARISQIEDGTSNTIALGEVLPDCNFEFWYRGWYDSQSWYVATSIPINYNTCRDQPPGNAGVPTIDCNSWNNWGTAAGFKSRHAGGAFFVFADASVHFLSESIEYRNYQRLGCRRDGETVESF